MRGARDLNIDFFKGVSVFGVLLIHTTFWSGASYVPPIVSNLSLLFDVPAFVFLAGMASNFSVKNKILLSMSNIYFIFVYIAFVYDVLTLNISFYTTISAALLNFYQTPYMQVLGGSYWFVPMFLASTLFASMILSANVYFQVVFMFLSFLYFFVEYFYNFKLNLNIFGLNCSYVIFYGALYVFGSVSQAYLVHKAAYRFAALLAVVLISTFFILNYNGIVLSEFDFLALQMNKFHPRLPYVLYSSISISIIIWLYGSVCSRYVQFVGRNALSFYVSQGISSSILMYIVPHVKIDVWLFKLLLMFVINVSIALFFCPIVARGSAALNGLLYNNVSSQKK